MKGQSGFLSASTMVESPITTSAWMSERVDRRNVGATVKLLVDAGWVESRPSSADRRERLLLATLSGREWWAKVQEWLAEERSEFFAGLTDEELSQLEALSRRLDMPEAASPFN